MNFEIKNKKIHCDWDKLLSPEQKEIVIKPGFGLSQVLPYMDAEDVKEVMDQVDQVLKEIESKIKIKY